MDGAVRNAAVWAGLGAAAAIRMASEVPARLLGRDDLGLLRVGALADLVLLDRDLTVRETLVGGRSVYRQPLPPAAAVS
jgi:N-acetylglucosamine-6-phosphate deacetylase